MTEIDLVLGYNVSSQQAEGRGFAGSFARKVPIFPHLMRRYEKITAEV
jgi:hypothetical protein